MLEDIQTFLAAPRIAYLSTINQHGYPHTVPVWFAPDGDDVIFSSGSNRSRIKHIQANSKGSVTIGGNTGDPAGYLIQGDLTIEEDADRTLLKKVISRYFSDQAALQQFVQQVSQEERLIVRLSPTKVIRV